MLSRKQVTVPMLHLKPKIDIIEEIPLNGHPPIDLSIKSFFSSYFVCVWKDVTEYGYKPSNCYGNT